jgi:hypothetical protein
MFFSLILPHVNIVIYQPPGYKKCIKITGKKLRTNAFFIKFASKFQPLKFKKIEYECK